MPMINGRFYSAFGRYPFRIANMLHRMQAAAANAQAESNLATLTDAMSGGTTQLSDGLSKIAAQRAVARIKATTSAHMAASSAMNALPSKSVPGDRLYNEIDRMINSVTPSPVVDVTG
jgi:hypothetical protein